MKKYLFLLLPFILNACANTVEVEKKADYKCGEQIISASFLDDNSVVMNINGSKTVLTRVESASGYRYDNPAAQITFIQKNGDTMLNINNHEYPLCREIVR